MAEVFCVPEVAILLPVYRGARTVKKTLQSLLDQDFKDFRILVGIDGPDPDSISAICTLKDQRVVLLVFEENVGLAENLNRMIRKVDPSIPFLAMAEQDDIYPPDRLSKQVAFLKQSPDIGLVSGIANWVSEGQVLGQFPGLLVRGEQYPLGQDMFLLNYRNQIKVVNSCMLWRSDVLKKHKLAFREILGSVSVDWDFILQFSLVSAIAGLPKTLVYLDRSPHRNSVTTNIAQRNAAARALINKWFSDRPDLISKKDYLYALNTQVLLELSALGGFQFLFTWFFSFIKTPWDRRFLIHFRSRLFRFWS